MSLNRLEKGVVCWGLKEEISGGAGGKGGGTGASQETRTHFEMREM